MKLPDPPALTDSSDEEPTQEENAEDEWETDLQEWKASVRKSYTDARSRRARMNDRSSVKSGEVGSLKEIMIGYAGAVEEAPEWEELEMNVDSGASVTVIGPDMVKAVQAKGARPDVKYEVADGSYIEHLGEKNFTAITDAGLEHYMTAQVTDVNKALLSVSKIVSKGCRVVFDEDSS